MCTLTEQWVKILAIPGKMAGYSDPRFILFPQSPGPIVNRYDDIDITSIWGTLFGDRVVVCESIDATRLMLDPDISSEAIGVLNWYRLERGIERLVGSRPDKFQELAGSQFYRQARLEFWIAYFHAAREDPYLYL